MKKLHLDFETRSMVDIKKVGAYKYAAHPSTEVLCLAYALDDEPVQIIKHKDKYGMSDLYPYLSKVSKGEVILSAFNAYFERCIFRFCVPRLHLMDGNYSDIWQSKYWQCTMAKACQAGMTGSLDVVCQLLGMKETKDADGKRVMMKMTKPRKPKKSEPKDKILWHETPGDFEKLYAYCKKDVVVERGIDKRLPDLPEAEQLIWQIDQRINDTGIPVNMNNVNKAIGLIEEQKLKADHQMKIITAYRVDAVTKVAAIKKELARYGVHADSISADIIDDLIESDIPKRAKEILTLRKDNGKSSTAKYEAIKNREYEGEVHGLFGYHNATTGRWNSRGIQLHNLPRGNIKDIDTALFAFNTDAFWMYPPLANLLSCLVRTIFISAKGSELCVADYSAIEARVLNWLAGQHDIVKIFAEGGDVYIAMAEVIYATKNIDDDKRFVGKQTELGCGYGMGSTRFKEQCKTYGQEVSEELAEKAVKSYRKSHPKVVKLWYGTEGMIKNAIKNVGKAFHFNGIYAKASKNFLRIRLLSGRMLYYYKPTIDKDKNIRFWGYDSQTHHVMQQYSYGAKFVENIVQATARDILANALVTLEGTKYETILHVHDEVVAMVEEGEGNVNEFCNLVTTLPEWAKGCPTKAEGWIGKYYKKD